MTAYYFLKASVTLFLVVGILAITVSAEEQMIDRKESTIDFLQQQQQHCSHNICEPSVLCSHIPISPVSVLLYVLRIYRFTSRPPNMMLSTGDFVVVRYVPLL